MKTSEIVHKQGQIDIDNGHYDLNEVLKFLNKIKEITNNKVKKLIIKEIVHAVCNGKDLCYSGPYKNIS